ncbi:unnamed protein product [Rhodiola kirilowii]
MAFKRFNPKPPPSSLPFPPQSTLPTITLSSSSTATYLSNFLHSHLKPSFTSQDLLFFLKSKLHHHPNFTQFDFHVFNWASNIDSFRHDHLTYQWITRTLAVTHRFNELFSVLDFIFSNPCPCSDGIFSCPRTEDIFRFSLNAFCRVGRLDDALKVFDKMQKMIDGKPNVAVYNMLIHGFVKRMEHERAVELYHRMLKDRVKPDVYTFNILISSYCRNSLFGLALEVFKEMRSKGCRPNVVSFNTLIKGFFREMKYDDAVQMAYEMIDLRCELSCATCEILVSGLCKGGKIIEACDLVVEFGGKGVLPNVFDCSDLVEMLCVRGAVLRALEVVDELWRKGYKPSLIASITLLEGLRKSQKLEEALRFTENILRENITPDSVTYNCLLEDLCKARRTRDAIRLSHLATGKGLDADSITYEILINGCSHEGIRKEGEQLVDEMLDKGFISDLASFNRMMEDLSKRKDLVELWEDCHCCAKYSAVSSNGNTDGDNQSCPFISISFGGSMCSVIAYLGEKLHKVSKKANLSMATLSAYLNEVLPSILFVKANNAELQECYRFHKFANVDLTERLKKKKMKALIPQVVQMIYFGSLSVFLVGSQLMSGGSFDASNMVAFLAPLALLIDPIQGLGKAYNELKEGEPAIERLFGLARFKSQVIEKPDAVDLKTVAGDVKFCDISFQYGQNSSPILILNGLNLHIKPGETVALVGPSGGGKTTLAKLILRLYNPASRGSIYIDNHDISNIRLGSLRS